MSNIRVPRPFAKTVTHCANLSDRVDANYNEKIGHHCQKEIHCNGSDGGSFTNLVLPHGPFLGR